MNLPSAYEQWKAETLEAGECRAIEGLLIARFVPLDEALSQIVPDLVALHPVERARLILDLSRAEIIEQFKRKLSR